MAKQTPTTDRPRVLDLMVELSEKVIDFRYTDRKPNLVDIGKCVIATSRALHVRDLDERISNENAAVMQIAKRRQLVS